MKNILNDAHLSFGKKNDLPRALLFPGIVFSAILFSLYVGKGLRADEIEASPSTEQSLTAQDNGKKMKCLLPKDISVSKKQEMSFDKWLDSFKIEALASGISQKTIAAAFENVSPIQKVIDLDRRQKEYSTTFSAYLSNSISAARISRGKSMLKRHATLLEEIEKKYGVQSQILLALWAMESNFGGFMGNFPTIATLATLAHEGRRHDFFRNELFCALSILEKEGMAADNMKSSWAGAMGQPQFMPSTFFHYAIDGSGDGKKDIWNTKADVLASAANYLKGAGWKPGQSWGFEVILPATFDPYHARLSEERLLSDWHDSGVKKANGKALDIDDPASKASIVLPSGINGPAFLVFQNFRVIREWNKSMNYALTVGHLSDRLQGRGGLVGKAPEGEKPLSRTQAISLQTDLKKLKFYGDKIDGMIGLNSRNAIREYQKSKNIPADGYPSPELILKVNEDAR